MRAIEQARRDDVIAGWERGLPTTEIARAARVSGRTVRRWVAHWQATGSVKPRRPPGRPRRIPATAADAIEAMVRANPTASVAALCQVWYQRTGQTVSRPTMSRTLTRFGWVKRRVS
jgi:transposase